MKLIECKEIADECGLRTWAEALSNVVMHSGMFFKYSEVNAEINELYDELSRRNIQQTDLLSDFKPK